MKLTNKKLAIALIGAIILITGCSTEEVVTPEANNGDVVVTETAAVESVEKHSGDDQSIMEAFDAAVKGSTTTDIINFIDENIEKVSKDNADKMIMGLEEVLMYDLDDYDRRLFGEGTQDKIDEVFGVEEFDNGRIAEIEDDELKAVLVEMISNGIKIESRGNIHYTVIDYSFLEQYNQYLSEEMGRYITFVLNHSENPVYDGWDIAISTDALVQRILEAEALLKSELPLDYKNQIGMYYTDYMEGLMKGSYSNPLFDHESGEMNNEDLFAVLKETAENHGDTNMGQVLTAYLEMIEAAGNAMTAEMMSAPFDLVEESLTQYFEK